MLTRLRRRLRGILHSRALDEELDEELRFHVDMETAHYERLGLSAQQARTRALREFGGVLRTREDTHDAHGVRVVQDLVRDLRLAARSLVRAPAFTLVALVTLALGIGTTTAVFSLVDGVLVRPLPYPEPDRLVRIFERSRTHERMNFAGANFHELQERATTLDAVAFFGAYDETILGADQPLRARAAFVSHDFFRTLGVRPALGRDFLPEEGGTGGASAVIVSHRFWQSALGGDPDWSRRVVRLGTSAQQVVGIMPEGFHFPARVDLWSVTTDANPHRTAHNWSVIGRLAPNASSTQLGREMDAHFAARKAELGDDIDAEGVTVVSLHRFMARDARTTLLVLLGAVGFVLLVACVNIASASLARGESRQRELAVRTALGAGRGRLVRQLLTENMLLALAGGVLGVVLAWLLVRGVAIAGSGALPAFAQVQLDARVLGFALLVSALTGLLVGTAPALMVTRNLRGAIGGGVGSGSSGRFGARSLLIGVEVAFALALLAGAGLLVRSLNTLLREDLGFRAERVLTVNLSLPSTIYRDTAAFYGDRARVTNFYERLLPALRAVPGVQQASVINQVPLGGGGMGSGFMRNGGEDVAGNADYRIVDTTYFGMLGIPLRRGRSFGAQDHAGAPHVVVINEAMAERYWPGADPLGDRIRLPGMDAHPDEWMTIIGVVGDVRAAAVEQAPAPQMFVPMSQRPERLLTNVSVLVHASVPSPALIAAMRAAVAEVDPNVPVEVSSLAALVSESVAQRRFTTMVLGTFAALALFLAAVGIYGVLAYSVAQRGREIGVRMALGARAAQVRALVLRDAMRGVIPGVIAGLAGALALSRVLRGMLYGVSESDPLTYLAVAVLLTLVALAASWIPARRATRVDPMVSIRAD